MNCKNCGCQLQATDTFCPSCGKPVPVPVPSSAPAGGIAATPMPVADGNAPVSGKATASIVCGILALFLSIPASIAAIVLGHLSLSEIKRSMGRLRGQGQAIAGLVLGYGTIAIFPIVLIVAAIAIPNILRARIVANEASAISSTRMLIAAEETYATEHPDLGYTCDLQKLSTSSSGMIDAKLASGLKSGYLFSLSGCAYKEPEPATQAIPPATMQSAPAAVNTFQVVAEPVNMGTTGMRVFCGDQTGTVSQHMRGSGGDCLLSGDPIS